MDAENRRSSTRYPVEFSGTATVGDEIVPIRFLNLSLGGALLDGLDRLQMGTQISLCFEIPTHDSPIEVTATVRWSTELALGVQFGSFRAREVWSLNKYLEELG